MLQSLFRNLLGFFVHSWIKVVYPDWCFSKTRVGRSSFLPSLPIPMFWFLLSMGSWLIEIHTQPVKRSRGHGESLQEKLQVFPCKHFINWSDFHSGNRACIASPSCSLPATSEKRPNAGTAFSPLCHYYWVGLLVTLLIQQ